MKPSNNVIALVMLFCGALGGNHLNAATAQVKVIPEVAHDISLPLSEMALMVEPTSQPLKREVPLYRVPLKFESSQSSFDNEVIPQDQNVVLTLNTTTLKSFQGLGYGYPGFSVTAVPPDTNLSVGKTEVVQWVNSSYVIFNKSTGRAILGPLPGNTFWQGFQDFSNICQNNNRGDPIVKYDQLANRWVVTQFAFAIGEAGDPIPPYLQCIAVSTTASARGSYYRYAYSFDSNFNDYGKLGVWPDAYYMSFVMFPPGFEPDRGVLPTNYGPSACALDRAKMLLGQAATMQCFQPYPAAGIFQPSDLDGTTPPPTGLPNYYIGLPRATSTNTTSLAIWKFHVDWSNPSNSQFVGPTALTVAPYSPLICNAPGGDCAVQKGTSQKLEVLSDRPMYRSAYRNFGNRQSIVLNHNIQATGSQRAATRWYEIRLNAQGVAAVFQQGTYPSGDGNDRWMGSIAMDKLGNMALGYSVSGPNLYPSIRYTGRLVLDPLGSMRTEITVKDGTGYQRGIDRWGDYSSMAIDPSDNCTFWYTTEYMQVTGFTWSTWITAFKFPSCV